MEKSKPYRFWKRPSGLGKVQAQVLEKTPQVLQKIMPGGRGGARNPPKPWIDVGLFYDCLKKHGQLLKNLGSYEHISSSTAPHPKALLDLQPLRSDLVNLEPSGMIHSQLLRQALLSLLVDMLAGKLTRVQYQCLMEGLEKIKVKEEEEEEEGEEEEEEGVLGKAYAAQRQLVPRDSDVTMGSEDIPDMFKSPAPKKAKKGGSGLEKPSPSAASGLEKPPPSAASGLEKPSPSSSKLVSQQRPGSRLRAAIGYGLEKSCKHVLEKAPSRSLPVLEKTALEKALPIKESHGLSSGKWVPKTPAPGLISVGWWKVAGCT